MSKTIRINELPVIDVVKQEDLIVVYTPENDRTNSISWEDMLGSIKEIPQPIFFARGSESEPSIAFVNYNAGFYSPEDKAVALTTNKTTRMVVDGDGNIDLGTDCKSGVVVFHNPITYDCDTTFENDVQIDADLNVDGTLEVSGLLDFIGNIGVTVDGKLWVKGNTELGDPVDVCKGTVNVNSTSIFRCDTTYHADLEIKQNLTVLGTSYTNHLRVRGDTRLQGSTKISGNVVVSSPINDNNIVINNDGNINLVGDLRVGGVISGDGAGIFNLNIPGSLTFKGKIDLTGEAPVDPQTGDLYITEDGPGTVNNDFTGIGGDTFQDNQFVFYTVDDLWDLGSIQDVSGFVTLGGDQTITGAKTYTKVLRTYGGLETKGTIVANKLSLTGKAICETLTQVGDADDVLTTKSYVDYRSLNAVADWPLYFGNYISGTSNRYDGVEAVTAYIDATPENVPSYIVARDSSGNFKANIITADLNGTARTSSKLDVTNIGSSSTETYPLFIPYQPTVNGVSLENTVYIDYDFKWVSGSNTNVLTVPEVVAHLTGDVTGNADTATALQTPRKLWSQVFDGTSNVAGDMAGVGNITPVSNNSRDIGKSNNIWANVHARTFYGYLQGSAAQADKTKEKLTAGLHLLSTNSVTEFNGSQGTTWYVDATSAPRSNKIVCRDNSGSFQANVIEANKFIGPLEGDVTGDISGSSGTCTGNAASATKLKDIRNLWGRPFDGRADVSGNIVGTGNITPSGASAFNIGSSSLPYRTLYADKIIGDIEGNSDTADKVNNPLKRGAYLSGGKSSFDGSETMTWKVNATPGNTNSWIVARDNKGNFAANEITAKVFKGPNGQPPAEFEGNLTGNVSGSSGSCTGNAASATRLQTPRTLWSRSFDGRANVSGDIKSVGNIVPLTGTNDTPLKDIGSKDNRFKAIYAEIFHGELDGIASDAIRVKNPLSRGSYINGTYNSFDGSEPDTWSIDATPSWKAGDPSRVVARDSSGNFEANRISATALFGDVYGNVNGNVTGTSGSSTGNAASATKLKNQRRITVDLVGDSEGTGSEFFDGSKNIEISIPTRGVVNLNNLSPLPA